MFNTITKTKLTSIIAAFTAAASLAVPASAANMQIVNADTTQITNSLFGGEVKLTKVINNGIGGAFGNANIDITNVSQDVMSGLICDSLTRQGIINNDLSAAVGGDANVNLTNTDVLAITQALINNGVSIDQIVNNSGTLAAGGETNIAAVNAIQTAIDSVVAGGALDINKLINNGITAVGR